MFSVFMFRNFGFCKKDGYIGFMTPFVWMFIKTYEPLRNYILKSKAITTLIQMEYSAFEEATVPICSFVLKNGKSDNNSLCFRLSDFKGGMEVQKQKVLEAQANKECGYFYEAAQDNFEKIPGAPVAYWLNENWFVNFKKYPGLREVYTLKKGTSTGDNNRFIKNWQEVPYPRIFFNAHTLLEAQKSNMKWFPINGGGERRKWYGNRLDIVNWEDDGREMKQLATALNHGGHWSRYIINPDKFFTECIGWSAISSAKLSARYVGYGFAFSSAAMESFGSNLLYTLGLLN
jgi:hypothetical protein